MSSNNFFPKLTSINFTVKNLSPNRRIKIFNYPIAPGQTRDLLNIPGVSEADIRDSLIKGELANFIRMKIISIVSSSIDLIQFDAEQNSFIVNASSSASSLPNQASGDLSGNLTSPTIVGIQNIPISKTLPSTTSVLQFNGAEWSPQSLPSFVGNANGINNRYLTDLLTTLPIGRQSVFIDGYRSTGDGGGGNFFWKIGTFIPRPGIIVVPVGYAGIGAWIRETSTNPNIYSASWLGAVGDGVTDDTISLQAMLDGLPAHIPLTDCFISSTSHAPVLCADGISRTLYKISAPLWINDNNGGGFSNARTLRGEHEAAVGFNYQSYLGPAIIDGNMALQNITFGNYTIGTVPVTLATYGKPSGYNGGNGEPGPRLNLSDYDCGDLGDDGGFAHHQLRVWCVYNPLSTTPGGVFMASGGNNGFDGPTTLFELGAINGQTYAKLRINGTTYTATTSTGTHITANVANLLMFCWDGTAGTPQLKLFINGAQPDASMSINCGVTNDIITQHWWEETVLGHSQFTLWPSANGPLVPASSGVVMLGLFGIAYKTTSINGRFGAQGSGINYMLPVTINSVTITDLMTSNYNADDYTKILVDYTGTNNNMLMRGGVMSDFVVGITRSVFASIYNLRFMNVFLAHGSGAQNFHHQTDISHLAFEGYGPAIYNWSSLNCHYHHLDIHAEKGIMYNAYSYNIHADYCQFFGMGPRFNGTSSCIQVNYGCQFFTFGPQIQTPTANTGWCYLIGSGSGQVLEGYPIQAGHGFMAITASTFGVDINCGYSDEGGYTDYSGILVSAPYCTLNWRADETFQGGMVGNPPIPTMKIGLANVIYVDGMLASYGADPMFQFAPGYLSLNNNLCQKPTQKVNFLSAWYTHPSPLLDPAFPGPLVHEQYLASATIVNYPSDANLTPDPNVMFFGDITVTDTHSWLSTGRNFQLQDAQTCRRFLFRNKTAKTISLITPTSTTPLTCATNTIIDVCGDGINFVAV